MAVAREQVSDALGVDAAQRGVMWQSLQDALYGENGPYERLQSVAFEAGTLSCGGVLGTIEERLPRHNARGLKISAKLGGGVSIVGMYIDREGSPIGTIYQLQIASKRLPTSGSLDVTQPADCDGLLPADLNPWRVRIPSEPATIMTYGWPSLNSMKAYAAGVNYATSQAEQVVEMGDFQPIMLG